MLVLVRRRKVAPRVDVEVEAEVLELSPSVQIQVCGSRDSPQIRPSFLKLNVVATPGELLPITQYKQFDFVNINNTPPTGRFIESSPLLLCDGYNNTRRLLLTQAQDSRQRDQRRGQQSRDPTQAWAGKEDPPFYYCYLDSCIVFYLFLFSIIACL